MRRRQNWSTRAPNKGRRRRHAEKTPQTTLDLDRAISYNDWRGQAMDEVDKLKLALPLEPLQGVWSLARFSYTSWAQKHVMAHGVETTWGWLKQHATKKGQRSGASLETQCDVEAARYFLVVGKEGPELFAIAHDCVYYHMSPACVQSFQDLHPEQQKARELGKWYTYMSFVLADLDVPRVDRFPAASPSSHVVDALASKYANLICAKARDFDQTGVRGCNGMRYISGLKRLCDDFLRECGQEESETVLLQTSPLAVIEILLQQFASANTPSDARQAILQVRSACELLIQHRDPILEDD